MAARVHTWSGKGGRVPAPLIDGPPASMGRRGAAPGGGVESSRPIAACAGPPEAARQPMGGRAGGGAATCCGVANVGQRRAALGPGGERRGRAAAERRRLSAPRERTEEGELQRLPGPEPCGVKEEALPAAGTRTRPARRCPPARLPAGGCRCRDRPAGPGRRRRPRRCCGRRSGAERSPGPAALPLRSAPGPLLPPPPASDLLRCRIQNGGAVTGGRRGGGGAAAVAGAAGLGRRRLPRRLRLRRGAAELRRAGAARRAPGPAPLAAARVSTGEEAGRGWGGGKWVERKKNSPNTPKLRFLLFFFVSPVGAELRGGKLPPRSGGSQPGRGWRRRVRWWSRASGARGYRITSPAARSLAGLRPPVLLRTGVPEEEGPGVGLVCDDGMRWR